MSNPSLWYYQCYLLECWVRSTNLQVSFLFFFFFMRPRWCWLVAVPWLGSRIIAVQPGALEGSSLPSRLHCISVAALPGGWVMGNVNGMTFHLPLWPCVHDPQTPLLKLMLLWKLWSRIFTPRSEDHQHCVTWERLRNAESQIPLQTCWTRVCI